MVGSPPRGWSFCHHFPAFPRLESSFRTKLPLSASTRERECDYTHFWTLSEFVASVKPTRMNTSRRAQTQTLQAWLLLILVVRCSVNWIVGWVGRTPKVKLTMNFKIKYNVHDFVKYQVIMSWVNSGNLIERNCSIFFFHFGDLGPCLDHTNHALSLPSID